MLKPTEQYTFKIYGKSVISQQKKRKGATILPYWLEISGKNPANHLKVLVLLILTANPPDLEDPIQVVGNTGTSGWAMPGPWL